MNRNFKDLTGQRFGRLTVLERTGSSKNKKAVFLCQCDCGKTVEVIGGNLASGTTTSCGCFKSELLKGKANPQRRRLKRIHRLMLMRCNNGSCKSYSRYGGRGIKVCEEWQHDFQAFYNWAMSHGYKDNLTIDRIDNTKGYCPENCRWATYEEQANNTSRVHFVEYDGEKMSVSRFARRIEANDRRVNYLINKGYTPEQVKGMVKL